MISESLRKLDAWLSKFCTRAYHLLKYKPELVKKLFPLITANSMKPKVFLGNA